MVKTVYFDHRHVHMTSWHMSRDSVKMMSHMQNVSPIPSNRYDEAISAVGIIKKVTGEKRQGGGTHPPPLGVRGLTESFSAGRILDMKSVSRIFDIVFKLDIGLYLDGSVGSAPGFFNKGVIWARLNIVGNLPSENEIDASRAIRTPKISRNCLSRVVGI